MNRLAFGAFVVVVLGFHAAIAQSDASTERSPNARVPRSELSSENTSDRNVSGHDGGLDFVSGGGQSVAPQSRASAADRAGNKLLDPKSGCAVLDVNALPVDSADWSGNCVGGLADGDGTVTYASRGKFFETISGPFDRGVLRDGPVTVKWADGSTYDGDQVAGRMQGSGVLTTADSERFQGQWARDRLNGRGLVLWANGDRYEGDWRDGKADGHGVQSWADGRKYDGEWRNDLPNGHGVGMRKDGSRYEGIFVDGRPGTVTEIAADKSLVAPPVAAAAPAEAMAANTPGSAAQWPEVAELAGKKLSAIDGSTLAMTQTEGGLAREIVAPNGAARKTLYVFLSDRLGTVYEGGDRSKVAGVFRLTDNGVAADYADGRSEALTLNGSNGLAMILKTPAAEPLCIVWYPQGHQFSAQERSAALAEYASRLQGPRDKKNARSARPPCAATAVAPVARGATRLVASHAPTHGKLGAAVVSAAVLQAPPARELRMPVEVPTSHVHLIDDDADVQQPTSSIALASNDPNAVSGAKTESASACLSVESDGRHWGFRNRCAYDVQFAYCQMNASDPLTSCRQGAAVSGSVAANGVGNLIADQSLKEVDADHDFRWVACSGGAGEVVVHLDRTDPPVGRCVRPGAS